MSFGDRCLKSITCMHDTSLLPASPSQERSITQATRWVDSRTLQKQPTYHQSNEHFELPLISSYSNGMVKRPHFATLLIGFVATTKIYGEKGLGDIDRRFGGD